MKKALSILFAALLLAACNLDNYPSPTSFLTGTVTYNGNESDGGTVPVDSNSPYESGATVTVLGNTGTLTKTGKTFGGWNTKADGTGTAYAADATFTIAADTVLYAVWTD